MLDDPRRSATQVQLEELHGKMSLDKTTEDHVAYLHTLGMMRWLLNSDEIYQNFLSYQSNYDHEFICPLI